MEQARCGCSPSTKRQGSASEDKGGELMDKFDAERESVERLRSIYENSMDGILLSIPETGEILAANPAACEMLRMTEEEIRTVGRDGIALVDEAFTKALGRPRREGKWRGEATFRRKDGSTFPVEMSSGFFRDPNGVTMSSIIFRDITERRRVERELKETAERFSTLADNISQLVWIADEKGWVFWYNKRWYEYTGVRPEEMEGWAWRKVHHPDHVDRVVKNFRRSLRRGEPLEDTFPLRGKDGRYRWFLSKAVPIRDNQGRIARWFGTNTDITELRETYEELRKAKDELERRVEERTRELQAAYDRLVVESRERQQTEAALRRAQKMEALGTLTGGIAHDFNNILAAMIGFAELTKERLPKGSREERYVQRVLDAGVRGRDLVRQMLTFARQTEQEKKPLQLSSLIKETVKLLRASIPTTIDIRTHIKSEYGVTLGDPVQFQQVLMNLATNAAYAMREKGGVLDIELSEEDVPPGNTRGISPGSYLKLVVRDTGTGIPPEMVDRIFDPFFTTKEHGEGTGLGLSVVLGIMKQHQGHIEVESEMGKGSTFTAYFPRLEEEPMTEGEGEREEVPTGSERILFIDDEEALVEMGQELLTELGYEVTPCRSSREALALFRLDPSRFDLVITDQTMPEMTGVELAKEILHIRTDTPVILSTGFSHLVTADSLKKTGIRAFLVKPLTKGELGRTVRRVLDAR